ncbi:MAG TPA: hypothetical protein VK425_06925 [Acidimicrobiales bacterium]|nr:hypothetical protein [Acidimicrobiales bacterium]
MSEDEDPAEPGAPPPPGAPGPAAGGSPPSGPAPASGPRGAPPAFSVQIPSIDVQALAKTPWVVGAAAILIGLVLYWAGSIVSAFQHNVGYDARERIQHLLGPGDADWAVIVLLAVALLVLGSLEEAKRTPLANFLYQLLLLAAALITVASVINAVIDLTYIGSSFDVSIYGFLEYLAGAPIAGAAALWAWRANPVALPGQKPKAA